MEKEIFYQEFNRRIECYGNVWTADVTIIRNIAARTGSLIFRNICGPDVKNIRNIMLLETDKICAMQVNVTLKPINR